MRAVLPSYLVSGLPKDKSRKWEIASGKSTIIEFWRAKGTQDTVQIFVWLCSINAGFWILARVMSAFVDVFSELFWEDLWGALATVYNIALAVFFSAIIFVSATRGAAPKDL